MKKQIIKIRDEVKGRLDTINEIAEIVAETSRISRSDAVKIGLGLFIASAPAMAQTTDPWGNFYTLTKNWIQGNLGKFIALLIFVIGLIIAAFSHSAKPIVYALILAVVIGGAVGLVGMFFNVGSSSFSTPSGW
ncbi:hypothetical protein PERMA_A0047 (plasmid) [Persephonella marina EX-H1]|uniref:Conjugal transfer protein TrbC n=1 Tax=Persephonella marina (strain DSM 14350 / EX-H1) TaxID=123214 RepID=C0QUX6_PERMH|nr:TrbC/VirB2 family protein [Persephonella marina]ACO05003.1 hypothetical protein PERMA_A0047 [Persephonella marina EX-H1]